SLARPAPGRANLVFPDWLSGGSPVRGTYGNEGDLMTGVVTANLEATLPLTILGPGGQQQVIEAVIDTGFNGYLTLKPRLIASLGLPWRFRVHGVLADGSVSYFNTYNGEVFWDGVARSIEIEEADSEPLLGMALYEGHELKVQIINGGVVAITPIP